MTATQSKYALKGYNAAMAQTATIYKVGHKIGDWTIVKLYSSRAKHTCLCACGTVIEVEHKNLLRGKSKSCWPCGRCRIGRPTHGMSNTRTYRIWSGMITRGTNYNRINTKDYCGRGISVCRRWRTFENFFADMGHCPEKQSIERINVNKGYSPSNCSWASRKEQAFNKTTSVNVILKGKSYRVPDIAELIGVSKFTLYWRLKKHGSIFKPSLPNGFTESDIFIRMEASKCTPI